MKRQSEKIIILILVMSFICLKEHFKKTRYALQVSNST